MISYAMDDACVRREGDQVAGDRAGVRSPGEVGWGSGGGGGGGGVISLRKISQFNLIVVIARGIGRWTRSSKLMSANLKILIKLHQSTLCYQF